MNSVNKNKNKVWLKEDLRFKKLEGKIRIPNKKLERVPFVELKKESDLEEVPKEGGCYWIWTNELINHSLHNNATPEKFDDGEVIYNGLAKEDIRGRVRSHLFGEVDAGWSGISMDIYLKPSKSHRKKAMSRFKGEKISYLNGGKISEHLNGHRINKKDLLLKLHLSSKEKDYIRKNNYKRFFFRNGINVTEHKHRRFEFKVYFMTAFVSLSYLEIIEKKWRENNGLPRLCSYKKGR